jgi:lipid A disaccharide synthetase
MVAGEASGDLLAGLLLGGLTARWPALHTFGIGGPKMAGHGFEAWWPHDKLAVRGYVEVLRHYREIVGIREQLAARLLRERPDLFIGVDAPDFNLDLEGRLKAAGIKAIHFVSPSIWAWRGRRIDKIGRCVDHVLCLFPFEPEIYERHGIAATYVGHPLALHLRGGRRCASCCRWHRACARCSRRSRSAMPPASRSSCWMGARTRRWPPATSRWSPAAPPRWRPRCTSARW